MSAPRRLALLAGALAALGSAAPASAHAATGAAPALGARAVLGLGSGVTDPRALAVTDLDGDGKADLVAGSASGGSGTVSVLRGTGGGAFAAPLGNPFGLGGTSGGVGALAAGDLNGDGRPDVLATIGSGTAANDQLVPLANDGTGVLSAGSAVTVAGAQLAGVALADLDGDGDLDALTASTTAVVTEQLGVLQQTPSGLTAVGALGATGTELARAVAAGDLTGDDRPDAVVVGPGDAWIASGSGVSLSAVAPVATSNAPVATTLADLDGDGDLDGLVLDGATNVLTVLRNDGSGSLTASSVLVDGLTAGTGLAAGDLNGDGHVDAVVTDGATGLVGVAPGDGAGGFGAPTWAAAGAGARSPVVADLDGDGLPDVATADAGGDTVSVLRNTGTPAPAGVLSGAFADQTVGTTGAARTITVTNAGSAPLRVTGVATVGGAADDFLVTGDSCANATLASDAHAACTVRVRFAPSASGARTAALRIRSVGGGAYDVPLTATATTAGDDDATVDPTPATTAAPHATTPERIDTVVAPDPPLSPSTTPRLILTLSHSKLTTRRGAKVRVGLALGRAAKVVLRVKRGGRTVDVVRASAHEGRNTVTWDGKLGRKVAPKGTYRLDVYAIAPDGRAARESVALVVK